MILKMVVRYNTRLVTVVCDRKRCQTKHILKGSLNDSTQTILETAGWQMGTLRNKARDICSDCKGKGLQ